MGSRSFGIGGERARQAVEAALQSLLLPALSAGRAGGRLIDAFAIEAQFTRRVGKQSQAAPARVLWWGQVGHGGSLVVLVSKSAPPTKAWRPLSSCDPPS